MTNKIFKINEITCHKSQDGQLGTFNGAMATEDVDRAGDIIAPNAFDNSIKEYVANNRLVKIYYNHMTYDLPVGVINPSNISKVGKIWYVKGELNINTTQGKDVYELMKQGALSDLSVNCIINDCEVNDKYRLLKELSLLEVSVVGEPANTQAKVYAVKGATIYHDLPLANRDVIWDSTVALNRVRKITNSEEAPSRLYRNAFFWFDEANADNFGAYKLPFADVIDGKLTAIPRGVFAAAAAMRGARGGVDIPEEDKQRVISHIEKYYKKMDVESPFEEGKNFKFISADDVQNIKSRRDFESILIDSGAFSRKASLIISSKFAENKQSDSAKEASNDGVMIVFSELKKILTNIKNKEV